MNLRLHFYVCLLPVIPELYFNNGAAVTEQIKIFATFCSFLCLHLSPYCSGLGERVQGSGDQNSRGLRPAWILGAKRPPTVCNLDFLLKVPIYHTKIENQNLFCTVFIDWKRAGILRLILKWSSLIVRCCNVRVALTPVIGNTLRCKPSRLPSPSSP